MGQNCCAEKAHPRIVEYEQNAMIRRKMSTVAKEIKSVERSNTRKLDKIKDKISQGEQNEAKLLSKELMTERRQLEHLKNMQSSLRTTQSQMKANRTNSLILENMQGASGILAQANKDVNPATIAKTFNAFEVNQGQMQSAHDMVALQFDENEHDEDANEAFDKVLSEICTSEAVKMGPVPASMVPQAAAANPRLLPGQNPFAKFSGPDDLKTSLSAVQN